MMLNNERPKGVYVIEHDSDDGDSTPTVEAMEIGPAVLVRAHLDDGSFYNYTEA
jgi:hypothetical protein